MKQHESPCKECCFRRDSVPGALGGSSPLTYIGQSEGPFWIPCHCPADYAGKETPYGAPQCAGAAIYRANLGLADRMPDSITKLPVDHESCFSSHAEFLAHHGPIPEDVAKSFLDCVTPEMLMAMEMSEEAVKVLKQ